MLLSTPQNRDMYSRFFVDTYDERQIISVSTGFQEFFGSAASGGQTIFSDDALALDIDIIRGNEKIAALMPRGYIARSLGSLQETANVTKFSSFSRVFPISEELGDINSNQILLRSFGETPLSGNKKLARMRLLARQLHEEQVRRTVRMFEVLASQAIRVGKMDTIIGTSDTDKQFNFHRKSTHTYNATAKWDAAGVDILAQSDVAWNLGRIDGKVDMDMLIVSPDVSQVFVHDTKIQALADNRRFKMVSVEPDGKVEAKYQRFVDAGFVPIAKFVTSNGHNFWMFTYNEIYTNASGVATPYLPVKTAIYTSSSVRCDRYFGPPDRMPVTSAERQWYREVFGFEMEVAPMPAKIKATNGRIRPDMFHFDAYQNVDKKTITTRCQSAPIFAPTQTDAFVTLNNVL